MKIGIARSADGIFALAAVVHNRVVPLEEAHAGDLGFLSPDDPRMSLLSLLGAEDTKLHVLAERLSAIADLSGYDDAGAVRWAAPIVHNAKILCHVVNYSEHGEEANLVPPESPFFFHKPTSSVVGHEDAVGVVGMSNELDFEAELALIIGKSGVDIPEDAALDHVAGYTIVNDLSYRDLQFNKTHPSLTQRYGQNWTQGKGLDRSCPIGPWVTLRDELPDPYPLRVRCSVNGEVRQDALTTDHIFRIPRLISEISRGMTLHTGDIIATGTPSGVGMGDGRYLRHGDEVSAEIEKIGILRNRVATTDRSGRA